MSRQSRMTRPEFTAWRADALRVSAFPSADAVVTSDAWWKDVTGAEPAVETLRKGRLMREEQGEALEGLLALIVAPGRIDWRLGALPTAGLPEELPSLGPFAGSLARLLEAMTRWAPASPRLDRLGLGAVAWVPAHSHEDAYGIID